MRPNIVVPVTLWLLATATTTPVSASELRLTVTSAQGAPLQISLELTGRQDDGSHVHRTTTTDEKGLGIFKDLAAGEYSVEATDLFTWKVRGELLRISGDETIEHTLVMVPVADAADDGEAGPWKVVQTWNSGLTGGSELALRCDEHGSCSASYSRLGEAEERPQALELSAQEQTEIRRLLIASRLFDGQQYGINATAVDGPYHLMEVTRGATVNVLVTSGNLSFFTGPRARLLRILESLRDRARDAQ